MKKRILPIIMIMVLVITMCTPMSFAASKTKTQKLYKNVVKSGNTVYVGTDEAIYKVNLKKNKVTKLKDLGDEKTFVGMRYYKGYLYYLIDDELDDSYLCRLNVSKKSAKQLLSASLSTVYFVISKSKIYYRIIDEVGGQTKKVMKLNGKSKKKTSLKAKNKYVDSNAKGYKLVKDYSEYDFSTFTGYITYKLKTPKKTYYLGYVYEENDDTEND